MNNLIENFFKDNINVEDYYFDIQSQSIISLIYVGCCLNHQMIQLTEKDIQKQLDYFDKLEIFFKGGDFLQENLEFKQEAIKGDIYLFDKNTGNLNIDILENHLDKILKISKKDVNSADEEKFKKQFENFFNNSNFLNQKQKNIINSKIKNDDVIQPLFEKFKESLKTNQKETDEQIKFEYRLFKDYLKEIFIFLNIKNIKDFENLKNNKQLITGYTFFRKMMENPLIVQGIQNHFNSQFLPLNLRNLLINNFKIFKKENYENNLYYKNIKLDKEIKHNHLELRYEVFNPYELIDGEIFQTHLIETDDNLISHFENKDIDNTKFNINYLQVGCFTEPFKFITLKQNNKTWMTITPNEIHSMQPCIDKAKGKILTAGLGLGYFQYMTSLKEDVEKITIIENNAKIIEFFKLYILPQFEFKDKIEIICANWFDYVKYKFKQENFDYVFVDIWKIPLDELDLYLKCKKVFKNITIPVDYWYEQAYLAFFKYSFCLGFHSFLHTKNQLDINNEAYIFSYQIRDFKLVKKFLGKIKHYFNNLMTKLESPKISDNEKIQLLTETKQLLNNPNLIIEKIFI